LARHDFAAFAQQALSERRQAGMPPFCYQALLRAEGRSQQQAQEFLGAANVLGQSLVGAEQVVLYGPVPMTVQRIADVERAQMLVESQSRQALQLFLSAWQAQLHELHAQAPFKNLQRWAIDVDPIAI